MQVFITGVSKGLGKALTEHFLNQGDNVVGIGRSHSIQHKNFQFLPCDLQDLTSVQDLNLGKLEEKVIFINNAGIIGSIKRISEQSSSDITSVLSINTLAPMLFCQKVLSIFPKEQELTIINISSGAAKRAIPSWASYCASKAALDLFSETIYLEEIELGRNIKVYAVSPGVIDTAMQEQIRSAGDSNFSNIQSFIELKKSGQLNTPETVVKKLINMLNLPYLGQVTTSLKEL